LLVVAVVLTPYGIGAQSGTSTPTDAHSLLEPKEIDVNAKSAVLMDADTGQVLMEFNKDHKIPPASFAKLLTLYIVFETIHHGKLTLDDEVFVSKKAWKTGGSRMFIEVNTSVPVRELIKGVAVVSGNDACVALAEHIYGSTDVFAEMMNETAQKIGMKNSHFTNPHGLPDKQQYTTAYDMALLARSYIKNFPEALQFHSMQEYTYDDIKQYNRNGLLRKDPSVDGLKTGYFSAAGYHLLATAKRGNRRLIAVVMGADNPAIREKEARKLLNYGYQNFELLPLFSKGQVLAEIPVWKGQDDTIALVATASGTMTVPTEYKARIHEERLVPSDVVAPIRQGQVIGKAVIKMSSEVVKSIPLVAAHEVHKAGLVKFLYHSAYLVGKNNVRIFMSLILIVAVVTMGYFLIFVRKRKRHSSSLRF
jgi:D-alanyl-D-alanine carboxypeptidase (penicillin-binding protein 5/6)